MVLPSYIKKPSKTKTLLGIDAFVHWNGIDPNEIAERLQKLDGGLLQLKMITNRGIKVWPEGFKETFCTDHWRCRFQSENQTDVPKEEILKLLRSAMENQIDIVKTENLYAFEGKPAFSLGQGQ